MSAPDARGEADLRVLAAALVAKLDAVAPYLSSQAMLAYVHGARYDGPNYGEELAALRAALAAAVPAGDSELSRFNAAINAAKAETWEAAAQIVATRAYSWSMRDVQRSVLLLAADALNRHAEEANKRLLEGTW